MTDYANLIPSPPPIVAFPGTLLDWFAGQALVGLGAGAIAAIGEEANKAGGMSQAAVQDAIDAAARSAFRLAAAMLVESRKQASGGGVNEEKRGSE